MNKVNETARTPMSDKDIHKYFPDARIITYNDLHDVESLQKLLPKKVDYVILLAETEHNNGHWVVLLKSNDRYTYFDPFGYRPDKFISWTPENLKKELGQDIPVLTILLNKGVHDGLNIYFNDYEFQDRDKNLSTCGRWVVAVIDFWLSTKSPTIRKFHKRITELSKKYDLKLDLLVSLLFP